LDGLNVSSFDVQNSSREHHAQEEAVEKQVDSSIKKNSG